MKRNEINIRDPYILLEEGTYYMYGTRGAECWGKGYGLDVYISEDLENWSEPIEVFTKTEDFWADQNFWAPEVHKYQGSYYMFVSFKSDNRCRGTQILKADSPKGPFLVHGNGPVTPENWECLDGTLYVENGKPYIVFCHEWLQVGGGEMCALELTQNLKEAVGEPVLLFKGSHPAWAVGYKDGAYETDGPFMYRTKEGELMMLWASLRGSVYCEALSYSTDGTLFGKWEHKEQLLFEEDGGHGMLFKDKEGMLRFICHQPNETLKERPVLFEIEEYEKSLFVKAC